MILNGLFSHAHVYASILECVYSIIFASLHICSALYTGAGAVVVVVVVDFIILLGESQQAVPFYREP